MNSLPGGADVARAVDREDRADVVGTRAGTTGRAQPSPPAGSPRRTTSSSVCGSAEQGQLVAELRGEHVGRHVGHGVGRRAQQVRDERRRSPQRAVPVPAGHPAVPRGAAQRDVADRPDAPRRTDDPVVLVDPQRPVGLAGERAGQPVGGRARTDRREHDVGGDQLAVREADAVGADLDHVLAGQQADARGGVPGRGQLPDGRAERRDERARRSPRPPRRRPRPRRRRRRPPRRSTPRRSRRAAHPARAPRGAARRRRRCAGSGPPPSPVAGRRARRWPRRARPRSVRPASVEHLWSRPRQREPARRGAQVDLVREGRAGRRRSRRRATSGAGGPGGASTAAGGRTGRPPRRRAPRPARRSPAPAAPRPSGWPRDPPRRRARHRVVGGRGCVVVGPGGHLATVVSRREARARW